MTRSPRRNDKIDVDDLKLLDTSGLAYKVTDGKVTTWIPKSLVEQLDDTTFRMPEWLAMEKELI